MLELPRGVQKAVGVAHGKINQNISIGEIEPNILLFSSILSQLVGCLCCLLVFKRLLVFLTV